MAEISDAQLAQYQKAVALLEKIHSNPEDRPVLERLAKKANPNAVTTEDIARPFIQGLEKQVNELQSWKSNLEKGQEEWSKNEQRLRLKKSGYTEDGLKAIEKIMDDRKIGDYEVAAAYWDKTNPPKPQAPNGISPMSWDFDQMDEDKEMNELLFKNEDRWLDRKSAQIMNEFRTGRDE